MPSHDPRQWLSQACRADFGSPRIFCFQRRTPTPRAAFEHASAETSTFSKNAPLAHGESTHFGGPSSIGRGLFALPRSTTTVPLTPRHLNGPTSQVAPVARVRTDQDRFAPTCPQGNISFHSPGCLPPRSTPCGASQRFLGEAIASASLDPMSFTARLCLTTRPSFRQRFHRYLSSVPHTGCWLLQHNATRGHIREVRPPSPQWRRAALSRRASRPPPR